MSENQLVKVEDLYADKGLATKQNKLNILVNHDPKEGWIRTNKFAGNSRYIPIGIIEYLLTSIFQKWKVEVKETQQLANSVVVCVRLHYKNPIDNEWDWQDGIGAAPLQTAKGAGAIDWNKINTSAVQIAAPAAESYAIKDAAEKIGKLFGKDLNRKDEMNYENLKDKTFEEPSLDNFKPITND